MSDSLPFARVGIAGLGLIGGSIALKARDAMPGVSLIGFDPRADSAIAACVDNVVPTVEDLAEADLIIVAVPHAEVSRTIAALGRTGTPSVVTDVGSTKRSAMRAAANAGIREFVGGHPMAGSERSGFEAARADLFVARPWLLVQGTGGDSHGRTLVQFIKHLGGVPRWIDADEHDRTVAYVSHLPQAIAAALMNATEGAVPHMGPAVAGHAFGEMTRLASSPPEMWASVMAENGDLLREALERFLAELPPSREPSGAWARQALRRSGSARQRWQAERNTRG